MSDPATTSAALLALTQAVGAFNSFLPPLAEVRKNGPEDSAFAADVRVGEVAAAALTLGVGTVVSSLTKSPVPVAVSLIAAVGLITLYESTLRTHRPLEKS